MAEYYGIDVSSNNGTPDWTKASGVSFAILRITQKYGIDKSFEHNFKGCKDNGIKVGVYRFSYAKTAEESRKEAEDVIKTLNNRSIEFPIFLDLEWEEQQKLSKTTLNDIVEAFRSVILNAGYKFGIYTGKYWYDNLLSDEIKSKCQFWIASVPSTKNDNGTVQDRLRPNFGVGWQYSWNKRIEGFGGPFDADVFYTDYSEETFENKIQEVEVEPMGVTAKDVLQVAQSWIGKKEADGSHKAIIDIYNSHKPLARGYAVKYTDQWCDTFVSAVFISLSAVDAIGGTECGVEEHVKLFKKAGIWNEDGASTPKAGDLIVFNWDKASQPNDGYSDHIGIVEKISNGQITTIEGNYKDSVARRTISVGYGCVRGFARPKYTNATEPVNTTKPSTSTSSSSTVAKTHTTVRLNTFGSEVKTLQTYLNKLGADLVVDGAFGIKTYLAVRAFQQKYGLEVDGIAGPKTWAKLESLVNTSKKSNTEIAKEVLAGKWGNQPDREKNLTAAGYNYQEIQNEVNKLLKK